MKYVNRRNFLKYSSALTLAGVGLATTKADAQPKNVLSPDRMGVLVDTTNCVGCRNCEWACKTAHDIKAQNIEKFHNREVFKEFRRPVNDSYTVVNEFKNPKNELIPINVKYQCMHCDKPACVSACIVGAFQKNEMGHVTWDGDKCIGCRYCMVACPFQIPTFEFEKAIQPEIHKCDLCVKRTDTGGIPACVEICPVEALMYGPRNELIRVARQRIKRNPGKYVNHIYGEKEVGGTSWMYMSSTDFDYLKFPHHGDKTAPGVSESIQHGIFAYFVPPLALYAWLGGIMWISKRRKELVKDETNEEHK
jgi:Fe-S-cluster-containing dehydrogenase component